MTKNKTTVLVRAPKQIVDELRVKFPDIKMPQLISVMYNTSALRAEAYLRNGKKKKL